MHTRGFPNCFVVSSAQGAFTANFPHALDEGSRHVAYILGEAFARGARTVEVTDAAEEEWVRTIVSLARFSRDFLESCTPGYYNNEGKVSELAAQNGFFGGGSPAFFSLMKSWRESGELKGLELA